MHSEAELTLTMTFALDPDLILKFPGAWAISAIPQPPSQGIGGVIRGAGALPFLWSGGRGAGCRSAQWGRWRRTS